MKKIMIVLLMVFLALPCLAALDPSIDNTNTWKNAYRFTNKPKDTFLQWCVAVEDALDGTDGIGYLSFTATNTEPGTTAGMIYYDLSENKFKYYNSASWVAIESGSAGNSLDGAYDVGGSITVDSGTGVTLTTAAASDSEALVLTHGETGAYPALTITNAGTDPAIEITTAGTGADITGTSATWSVAKTGVATLVGGIVGNSDLVFSEPTTNDITLLADGDGIFTISAGSMEDLDLNLATSNTLTLTSSTDVDTIAFGALDAFTGVASIAGDAGADFALSAANTGTYNFTIAQAGVGDNELRLTSAGTAANAIALTASTGGITATAVDDLILTCASTTTADDLVIQQTGAVNASVLLKAAGTGADAISAVATAGGITLTSVDDMILTCASTTTADDLVIQQTGAQNASVLIKAAGTGVDAISLQASAGGIDIDAIGGTAGDLTMNSGDDMTITTVGNLIATSPALTLGSITTTAATVLQSGTGDLALTSTDDITLTTNTTTSDNITITNTPGTATDAIAITATAGGITHTSANVASAWTHTANGAGDDLSFIVAGAADGSLVLSSTGTAANAIDIDTTAGGIDIDMAGGIAGEDFAITTATSVTISTSEAVADQLKVDATGVVVGNAINFETTNGGILLNADGANGAIGIDSAATVTITAATDLALAVTGNVTGNIQGDGANTIIGYKIGVEVEPGTAETLLVTDSGKVFANTAAQGATTYTLPDCAAGLLFYFVDNSSTGGDDVIIDCQADDNIDHDTNGDAIESVTDAYPQTIILIGLNSTDWATIGKTGTWGAQ